MWGELLLDEGKLFQSGLLANYNSRLIKIRKIIKVDHTVPMGHA